MGVAFHDGQRGVKEEPEQQVAQLTQPSPFDRDDLAVYEAQTLFIGLLIVGMADELPEGESLPRPNDDAVHRGGRQLQVIHLVALVRHVVAAVLVEEQGPGGKHLFGQGRRRPAGIPVPVQPHPQVKPFDLKEAAQGG